MHPHIVAKGKISYHVSWNYDPEPDLSWLGKYSYSIKSYPVYDRKNACLVVGTHDSEPDEDGNTTTVYDALDLDRDGKPVTVEYPGEDEDSRSSIGRHEARYISGFPDPTDPAGCIQDARRLESFGGAWSMHGCSVQAFAGDIAVSEPHEFSLWGIESDCGDAYAKEVEDDLIAQAEGERKRFLREWREQCAQVTSALEGE
ncbi:MAG: hypothetical protein H0X04_00380 [Chthoniobacterales bacterium]|nr:hypothetical protein [Chthoniobacterales bacterium]